MPTTLQWRCAPSSAKERIEGRAIEIGKCGEVAMTHRGDEARCDVAARIFQQRDDVVGDGPQNRILEIEQAAGAKPGAARNPHEIVDVIIAQHRAFPARRAPAATSARQRSRYSSRNDGGVAWPVIAGKYQSTSSAASLSSRVSS